MATYLEEDLDLARVFAEDEDEFGDAVDGDDDTDDLRDIPDDEDAE